MEDPGESWFASNASATLRKVVIQKKKQDELKLRVVLRKEGEIGQAGRIKGLMRASGDL